VEDMRKHRPVVVEGHCILHDKKLVSRASVIFFINISRAQCEDRFMGRQPHLCPRLMEAKRTYFSTYTWPTHAAHYATVVGRRRAGTLVVNDVDAGHHGPGVPVATLLLESRECIRSRYR
jgi:hypothetical protein